MKRFSRVNDLFVGVALLSVCAVLFICAKNEQQGLSLFEDYSAAGYNSLDSYRYAYYPLNEATYDKLDSED
jgi:hypothetical protein